MEARRDGRTRPLTPSREPLRRRRPVSTSVVTALVLVLSGACGGTEQRPGGSEYVALGDSISAGAGIAPVVDAGCLRSKVNYASLVARQMDITSFKDVSCAGATTANLLRPQFTNKRSHDPQIDALGTRTKLVTIAIGLNDKQLAYDLFASCLEPPSEPTCQVMLDMSDATLEKQLSDAADRVVDALEQIKTQAPNARVILVGYARFFPDTGSCPDRVPMIDAMVGRLRSALVLVNDDWKEAADRAGADYIDTYEASQGHDVCSDVPWINGAKDVAGQAAAIHPFANFHQAVAAQIVGLLKQ
jgi:lysophospholipase L1-like esterase